MTATPVDHSNFLWTPRRQVTLAQTQRRTLVVRWLRRLFTAGAAVSMGILAGPVIVNALSGLGDGRRSFPSSEIVTMINPRFTGRDSEGTRYVITADQAQRRRASESLVDLVNPTLVDQVGSRVTAPEGTFDQDTQTLDLFRDVRVVDQAGYRFQTTSARFYVLEGRIEGMAPLQGEGPLGDIRSDSYEITEDGDVITFNGNVEMIFQPAPEADAQPQTSEIVDEVEEGENE